MKGYKPPHFEQEEDVNLDDVDAVFNESKVYVNDVYVNVSLRVQMHSYICLFDSICF